MLFSAIAFGQATTVTLQEGQLIKVALEQDLNGKTASVGQKIDLVTSDNLIIDSRVVIPQGCKVSGTITEARKSKGLGKKGALAFSIEYLYLADGKVIKLRGQQQKNLNGSGGVVAASAVLLTPFALLIHGKNAKYKKGDVFEVYIDQQAEVQLP